MYTKRNQDIFAMEEHVDPAFKYSDEFEKERGKYKLNQTLDYDSLQYSSSLDYPLEIEGETFYAGGDIENGKKEKKEIINVQIGHGDGEKNYLTLDIKMVL